MKKYLALHKQIGETPLSVIQSYKVAHPEYSHVPMAYAGRLDPMASGKLLVLVGDECKRQSKYHALDKEYDFEILFGFSSDTGDVLGLAEQSDARAPTAEACRTLEASLRGSISLPYPQYSSKTVKGKPLFLWTLENRLGEIDIPTQTSEIYRLHYRGMRTLSRRALHAQILQKINSIPEVTETSKALGADFRRDAIRARWKEVLETSDATISVACFSVTCSSGMYVRSLAPYMSKMLGTTGLAYAIHRTRIGKYIPIIRDHGVWLKSY